MQGRKPIYNPETLEIGDKIALSKAARDFAHQYAYQFREKLPGRIFKKVKENGKIYIKRTA